MRHRIVNFTGFGNPDSFLLNNAGELPKAFLNEAYELFFTKFEGVDYQLSKDEVRIGFEPGYQYENLKIISINQAKGTSYIQYGKAWGGYGSQLVKRTKYYVTYKYKGKFVKFIDKWHPILFKEKIK